MTWLQGLDSCLITAETKVHISSLQSRDLFSVPQTKFSFRKITPCMAAKEP